MTNFALCPSTTFNHLLADLEIALDEEAQRRYTLSHVKEALVVKEAKTSLEEREHARTANRKTTESELESLVRTNAVVLDAQEMVRTEQLRYDLGKMLTEIARYRVQFALSAARYRESAID